MFFPGGSSGANLATGLTLKMRSNRSIQKIKLQVLLWPILQAFDFNPTVVPERYTRNPHIEETVC